MDKLIESFEKVSLGDISGEQNVLNDSSVKNWVKLISKDNLVLFDNYTRKEHFKLVADVVLDTDINPRTGKKRRNTLIKFVPCVDDYHSKDEWLYIFTINDAIVKIGGTRNGLGSRVASYMCGHHIKERGKSGDCSKTNGFIYNTFEFYLNKKCKIQMYGYKLPKTEIKIDIFDKQIKVIAQTYHAYESTFLEDYKKKYTQYPVLNDNCDPDYK
uniref:Uncharacterized protein n=1 Tax=viral metagenome TaxID=1070528 RepID=A0A6C0I961_9ZZZZ